SSPRCDEGGGSFGAQEAVTALKPILAVQMWAPLAGFNGGSAKRARAVPWPAAKRVGSRGQNRQERFWTAPAGPQGSEQDGAEQIVSTIFANLLGNGAAGLVDAREAAIVGAIDHVGLRRTFDYAFVDDDLGDVAHGGQLVHGIEQHCLQNGAQATGARLALHGTVSDRFERIVPELELRAFHLEEAPVLLGEGVLRVRQNGYERGHIQLIERCHYREPTDELRYQAVLDEILGLHVVEQVAAMRTHVDG